MDTLTKRQLEVVTLAAEGMTNTEIARELRIEASSVKDHIGVACKKLAARNRTHMVHRAHLSGYFGTVASVHP